MKITVDVTQEDIDRGHRLECEECPVAHALRRSLPTLRQVVVGRHYVTLGLASGTLTPESPEGVRAWVDAFDRGEPAGPFSFTLEL